VTELINLSRAFVAARRCCCCCVGCCWQTRAASLPVLGLHMSVSVRLSILESHRYSPTVPLHRL
jgi:hypothetical protein